MNDINKAYQWSINTCNAPNVGYSQTYRNQQTVNGITYYDCSSFIWYALAAGGFPVETTSGSTWPFTTYSMGSVLTQMGFSQMIPSNVEWLPGDILVVNTATRQHTEMVYQEYKTMGAHSANYALADQVSINTSDALPASYEHLYRYGSGAMGYGSSIYVVAAIAGNFWQESGINPGIWEGLVVGSFDSLNIGYGLGQWTNTNGDTQGRLWQLYTWLTENGYALDSGDGQLAFLIHENVWYSTGEAADYATLEDFLSSTSTDLTALTHAWNIGWEGIHDSSWDARVEYAQKCFDYIQAHANDTSINTWAAENAYLSETQRLNNAVMLYRYLSAGGGGGGTAGKKIKLPVYMMLRNPRLYNRRRF